MEQLVGRVSGANVEFAAERADGDGVLVQDQQVVAEAAVHVAHPVHSRGHEPREKGDEHTGFDRLVLQSNNSGMIFMKISNWGHVYCGAKVMG